MPPEKRFLISWLFPVFILVLGLRQPRGRGTFRFALIVEFVFLVGLGHLPGGALLRVGVALILASYGLLFATDHAFFDRIGSPLDVPVLRLAGREKEHTRILIVREASRRDWIILAAATLAAGVSALAPGSRSPWPILLVSGAGLVAAFLVVKGRHLPAALNLLRSLACALRRAPGAVKRPVPSERLPFPAVAQEPPQCSVLLLVIESLSAQVLDSPEGREAAPRYHRFLAEQAARTAQFPLAISNSTASDVSYPSLFTGLSPEQSPEVMHRQPLIWAAAKAAGCRTMFYSSQSLRWASLDSRLLHDTLDIAVHRDVLRAPAVNDLAMDDRCLNRILLSELPKVEEPFLAIVNYNMLHHPFHGNPSLRSFSAGSPRERYLNALAVFDACFGDLMDAMEEAGRLEDTAIALVADHGECPEAFGRPPRGGPASQHLTRLHDLHPELLAIPFWLRLPEGAYGAGLPADLAANRSQTVSNVDLYPTILDLLGFDPVEALPLSGHSLLRPLPEDRMIVSLNSGALRLWEKEPFALARGRDLLIYHDLHRTFELVDLAAPGSPDRWPTLPLPAKQQWLCRAKAIPVVDRIVSSRNLGAGLLIDPAEIVAEYDHLASLGEGADLHQLDNWRLFSKEDWEELCLRTAAHLGLRDGQRVFESGCGAGAFLDTLRRHFRIEVAGVDFSEKLVAIARSRLEGSFRVGDAQHLPFVADESYDCAVSHGVFLYLASVEAADRAARELVRITKPGGTIYVGVVNDPDRLAAYQVDHQAAPSGNYLLPRRFWLDFAERECLEIRILDQDRIYSKPSGYDAHSRMRYSVFLRKPGGIH